MTNSLTTDHLNAPFASVLEVAPKVLLHDHLDGGVRPRTVVELAAETGYDGLPTTDVEALSGWFVAAANSGSLERYLETFAHTVGVMQTPEALARVASECAQDLAADGVVYAEVRYAPELHVERRGPGSVLVIRSQRVGHGGTVPSGRISTPTPQSTMREA